MLSKIFILLTGLVSIMVVYPLGVIIPFMWNFRWNPKGWVFEEFKLESDECLFFFGVWSDKWSYYGEVYPTFFHLLVACFLIDSKSYRHLREWEVKLLNTENEEATTPA
jgi:hypothetical protein